MKKVLIALCVPFFLCAVEGKVQGRFGYFYFASSTARTIYDQGTADIEVEGDIALKHSWRFWMNVNYVWKQGHSEEVRDSTHLRMGTFSCGAKFLWPPLSDTAQCYVGLGLSEAYLNLNDDTNELPRHTNRWGVGLVAKSGLLFHINRRLFLDLFFDYYYQPMRTRGGSDVPHYVNLGGLRMGIGAGAKF
jgi:hypothetical protein